MEFSFEGVRCDDPVVFRGSTDLGVAAQMSEWLAGEGEMWEWVEDVCAIAGRVAIEGVVGGGVAGGRVAWFVGMTWEGVEWSNFGTCTLAKAGLVTFFVNGSSSSESVKFLLARSRLFFFSSSSFSVSRSELTLALFNLISPAS